MSDDVAQVLSEQLKANSSDWAVKEDAVRCVLRLSTDESIHGT